VVIPIKSFRTGWSRLAGHLDDGHRERLAVAVADLVVRAASGLPTLVVTDDAGVEDWASGAGLATLAPGGGGLDRAVESALAHLDAGDRARHHPARRAVVVHADLPLAADLTPFVGSGESVLIVTDRHRDGTNILSIPRGRGFRVAYGIGSAERHRAEAVRLGLGVETVLDPALSWDLDTPEDLDHPEIRALLDRIAGVIP